jgi:hypothetical protein
MQDNNNALAARRRAAADAIVVDNERTQLVRDRVRYMIEHANNKLGGTTLGQVVVGLPQSGKTTILRSIANELNTSAAQAAGQLPALLVTLDEEVTRKQLAQNILEALEDHGFLSGPTQRRREGKTETELLRKVRLHLRAIRCRILMLDEFHQIRHRDSKRVAYSVGESIKRMLNAGICPVLVCGLQEARLPFDANPQLSKRSLEPITLEKLNALHSQDAELFMCFLEDYLTELEVRGIVRCATDLLAGTVPAGILLVTDGVLGDACNFIKHAIDEATWAGRDRIARVDLSTVVKKHFSGRFNPFEGSATAGIRETRKGTETAL